MTATSLRRRIANELAERLCACLGERIHSIVLFGSVARGDANCDSDVDVLIIGDGLLSTKKQIYDICVVIGMETHWQSFIQPLMFTLERLRREVAMRSWLAQDILQQGIVLYDDGTYQGVRRDALSASQ